MNWHGNGLVCLTLLFATAKLAAAPATASEADAVVSGVSENAKDQPASLEAFQRRALRFAARPSMVQGYYSPWRMKAVGPRLGFVTWTDDYEQLDRAAALRHVGAEELADEHEIAVGLAKWSIPLSIGAVAGLVLVGGMVGAGVGAAIPADSSDERGENMSLGALGGALVGDLLALVPAIAIPLLPQLFAVEEREAADQIRSFNRKIASEEGLPDEEIPFEYLGY